ncbi:hypothetical protein [Microbacterium jiangjiandongii]|uniref:hypothetical protein n=1 Tax=Microbacterium jiangjiandongii TaxID=3049071 RepID=UPI00214B2685|nr:hypothetical protein [Microbacterium sp. zg.Y843]MCR2814551.1 hypothetical protein [Microbacterium sp. zg.Y843]
MANPKQPRGDATAVSEPDSLSALVARVLNQLSLSAWLPGAFVIASAIMLAWFWRSGEVTLSGFGRYVEGNWIPVLLLALPLLVIATLLTQAFAFEAIRTLEGYWAGRGPASWWRSLWIRCQLRRKRSLERRYRSALAAAFRGALPRLVDRQIDGAVLRAIKAKYEGTPRPSGLSAAQRTEAAELEWWDDGEPWDTARLIRLDRELADFPEHSRMMPTKLGNILRAAEDGLVNHGGNLEGFVMANRESAPARVMEHHDQFRTRLDMYCTLVFVAIAAALASVPALWDLTPIERLVVPLALLLVSWASYHAALSSARGYGTALRQIDASISLTSGELS